MKLKKIIFFSLVVFLICFIQNSAKAENDPVMITISNDKENLVFDGKWSNVNEWKQSSLNEFIFEDKNKIILRTAHQGDFIYILLDAISDFNLDKGADKAIVCFDANNDKTTIAGEDDFCFGVLLGNNIGFVLQGGEDIALTNNFEKIPNPIGFIGIGGVSDQNDRYTQTPHSSYEFKIPIELLDRSDNYGFYISVYDANSDKFYSWPNVNPQKPLKIPSPAKWGDIISPDKSIPEFDWPVFLLLPSLLLVIYLTRKKNIIK